jgi:large conductance mechanosensitive channel
MVKDVLTPLIAAVAGRPNFSAISLRINNSQILIGDFLNELVSFVLIAAALYFFVVAPVNAIVARQRRGEAPPDPDNEEVRRVPERGADCGQTVCVLHVAPSLSSEL